MRVPWAALSCRVREEPRPHGRGAPGPDWPGGWAGQWGAAGPLGGGHPTLGGLPAPPPLLPLSWLPSLASWGRAGTVVIPVWAGGRPRPEACQAPPSGEPGPAQHPHLLGSPEGLSGWGAVAWGRAPHLDPSLLLAQDPYPESVSYVLGAPGRTFTLHLRKNRYAEPGRPRPRPRVPTSSSRASLASAAASGGGGGARGAMAVLFQGPGGCGLHGDLHGCQWLSGDGAAARAGRPAACPGRQWGRGEWGLQSPLARPRRTTASTRAMWTATRSPLPASAPATASGGYRTPAAVN